jgi:hypothetical protein
MKKKLDEQAHVAQAEEEGEALLVACASLDVAPAAEYDVATRTTAASLEVHLMEDKLFV